MLADRGDVGVLFIDLLFALVVVELLEPLRDPADLLLEGWLHLSLAFTLTLLSWIGYHLSVSRIDEQVRIDSPQFVHLLLDVLMVVAYWLSAISYESSERTHSWWFFPRPSAVPEAALVTFAFALYVAWDLVARWIHGSWAERVNRRRISMRTPYAADLEVWNAEERRRWRRRAIPTRVCLLAVGFVLAIAILTQEVWTGDASLRMWVVGLDVSLYAAVIGFRTSKEWRSYPTRLNRWLSLICLAAFISGIGVPLIVAI